MFTNIKVMFTNLSRAGCTKFRIYRVSQLSKVLDITIVLLESLETLVIQKRSEGLDDGFVSHDPESEILSMIYNQPNRNATEFSKDPEPTTQMIASLEEITVTQEIIGKNNYLLFFL